MKWLPRRSVPTDADAAEAVVADETRERARRTADETRERARRTGDVLRQTRTERGVSLVDVEQDIRINRVYIEALENARFDLLPAPVYARGFMRSYARYLGLDPDEALRAVPRNLPRPTELAPSPSLRRATPRALPTLPALNRPMAIGIGAVVLLLAVALYVVPRLGGSTGIQVSATVTATSTVPASSEAPNLVGATREVATAALERAGLTPLIFESANTAPAGTVFRQSPGAGTPVKRGDVITLFVSQGAGTPAPTPTATPAR